MSHAFLFSVVEDGRVVGADIFSERSPELELEPIGAGKQRYRNLEAQEQAPSWPEARDAMRARVFAEDKLAWARPFLAATTVAKSEASLCDTLTKIRMHCAALTEELDRLIAKIAKDD